MPDARPTAPATVPALRAELARRDAQMTEIAGYVVHVSEIATELSQLLAALLAAHAAGDLAAVRAELDAAAAHYHRRARRMH